MINKEKLILILEKAIALAEKVDSNFVFLTIEEAKKILRYIKEN